METRFKLSRGCWYALEMIGDEFSPLDGLRHCSPIRVDEVMPARSGHRYFQLSFYHAHYPEGVRDKTYVLQMIERGNRFILARNTDHAPMRLLLIFNISWRWLERRFGIHQHGDDADLENWLSRNL